MENFKFSYDEQNDDLFVYLDGKKSEGAVEMGNFVFDFDKEENLVAIQISDASKVLSKLLSKIINLAKITSIKLEIINFRNMTAVRMFVETSEEKIVAPIIVPRVKQMSPALNY